MVIAPVDENTNLFQVQDLVPDSLLAQITSTDWVNTSFNITDKQEWMVRKSITDEMLPWNNAWRNAIDSLMLTAQDLYGISFQFGIHNTTWWIDEPGFDCIIHTDDPRVRIALQMFWVGNSNLGTTFYHDKNVNHVRKQFDFIPNTGYLLINNTSKSKSDTGKFHDMMTPIPKNTFRLTSYTWLYPGRK
jgi:hypothetical protein